MGDNLYGIVDFIRLILEKKKNEIFFERKKREFQNLHYI